MALTQISTAGVKDDAVTAGKIPANAVGSSELADNAVDTAAIANDAVTVDKVADDAIGIAQLSASGTASSSTFLRGDNSWTTVNTDLVSDTSPQLGGALDTNGSNINFGDSTTNGTTVNRLTFGTATNGDLALWHDGNNSYVQDQGTGELRIRGAEVVKIQDTDSAEDMAVFNKNGSVELYHNNSKKFETESFGATLSGGLDVNSGSIKILTDSQKLELGAGGDLKLYHDGSNQISYVKNTTNGNLYIQDDVGQNIYIRATPNENAAIFKPNAAVELFYDNSKKLETGVSGDYGSFTVSNGTNGWSGMSIGGATVFMGDGTDAGIWNDTDNEWMLKCNRGASTELQYDGSKKFETTSEGAAVYDSDGDSRITFFTNGSSNRGSVYASSDSSVGFLNSSGNWSFRVDNNKSVHFYNHAYPQSNNSYDLGSSSYRWRNIYTQDLQLSNEAVGDNGIDGTWGNYTIVEGESDLFLKNNRSSKTYKFNLTEVS